MVTEMIPVSCRLIVGILPKLIRSRCGFQLGRASPSGSQNPNGSYRATLDGSRQSFRWKENLTARDIRE